MSDRTVGIVALLLIAGACALYLALMDLGAQYEAEDAARATARAEEGSK